MGYLLSRVSFSNTIREWSANQLKGRKELADSYPYSKERRNNYRMRKFCVVLLCLSLALLAVVHTQSSKIVYHQLGGAKKPTTFSILKAKPNPADGYVPVERICFTVSNGAVVGVTLRHNGDNTVRSAGTVSQSATCISLISSQNYKIRAYEISSYKNGVGYVRILTTNNQQSAVTYGPLTSVRQYEDSGVAKNAVVTFYLPQGLTLVGVHGGESDNKLFNLGFVFDAEQDSDLKFDYQVPIGNAFRQINLVQVDETKSVDEVCCFSFVGGVKYFYMRAGSQITSFPNINSYTSIRCLDIKGKAVKWESRQSTHFGGRLGQLKITTNDNQVLECIAENSPLTESYSSGTFRTLVGVIASYGEDIDSMAPVFRQGVKTYQLVAYTLNEAAASVNPLPPKQITQQRLSNKSSVDQEMKITGSYTSETTSEISNSDSTSQGSSYELAAEVSVTASAEASFFVDVSVEASLKVGYAYSDSSSFTQAFSRGLASTTTETFSYEVPVKVPANTDMNVAIRFHESKRDIPYTALIRQIMLDDSVRYVTVKGTFKDADYKFLSASFTESSLSARKIGQPRISRPPSSRVIPLRK